MTDEEPSKYLTHHLSRLGGRRRSLNRSEALRANYSKHLPDSREARILEIGPGFGEFLKLAVRELGYVNVEAIDTSSEVVEHCRSVCARTIHVEDSVKYLRENPRAFDRVVLLHVLEHVPKGQILALLNAIRDSLHPDRGQVLIEVPNMAHPLTGTVYRYADFTHEVGFTASSLTQVLRMAGFEEIRVRKFATPLGSPLRLIQAFAKWAIELALQLLLRVYQQQPDLVSANLVAIASPKSSLCHSYGAIKNDDCAI